jgi:hypothetical protein
MYTNGFSARPSQSEILQKEEDSMIIKIGDGVTNLFLQFNKQVIEKFTKNVRDC